MKEFYMMVALHISFEISPDGKFPYVTIKTIRAAHIEMFYSTVSFSNLSTKSLPYTRNKNKSFKFTSKFAFNCCVYRINYEARHQWKFIFKNGLKSLGSFKWSSAEHWHDTSK